MNNNHSSNSAASSSSATDDKLTFQRKCVDFLNISDKIRYVGILNKFGRTIAGKLRKETKPFLSPEQARNEHFIESVRQQLRNSFNSSIGKTHFSITKNEHVTLILIPSQSHDVLYYITTDNDATLANNPNQRIRVKKENEMKKKI
jgi:hypothetical protein